MKLVKGKLYSLILHEYTFYVVTSCKDRAETFYSTVFPEEYFSPEDIVLETTIFSRETLRQKFEYVKSKWNEMDLLQAEPGTIKFNKYALDILLDNQELMLTN